MIIELRQFAAESFVGVTELAAAANRILVSTQIFQNREKVSSLPDERTVRYYITEGLISPAEEKQGTSSVFGYLQLLQLLVIKKLQAENLSIRQIRTIIAERQIDELERLLETKEKSAIKNDAQQFLESLLVGATPNPPEEQSVFLNALKRRESAPPNTPPQTSLPAGDETRWKRIEIAPDLELHIGENFDVPSDAKETGKLLQKFQQIVESQRKGKK